MVSNKDCDISFDGWKMEWLNLASPEYVFSNDESQTTQTSDEQARVEQKILIKYRDFEEHCDIVSLPPLKRQKHVVYLKKGLEKLSRSYQCLDASQPWLCYWIVHSLTILNEPIEDTLKSSVCKHLKKCQQKSGGFGGGPMQFAHLATTYAAVNCLCDIGTEEAYRVIDRKALIGFLKRMHNRDGSFCMHEGGEADTRSVYCAASIAKLTGIYPTIQPLFSKSAAWILSCQTYEGGIGGCPGTEAHGGYTFCGLAALVILNGFRDLDLESLMRWACNRQMRLEGGFQGRTNKLVDACYSFWQGGLFPLIHCVVADFGGVNDDILKAQKGWLYDQKALQYYLLVCCQFELGGVVDKPGKGPDFYHTCYGLSGLTSSQHSPDGEVVNIGPNANQLKTVHPVFNVAYEAFRAAVDYFSDVTIDD